MTVSDLVRYLQTSVGSEGATDMVYLWLEDCFSIVFGREWSWNWTKHLGVTIAPITESAGLFTWTAGQNYITCSSPMTDVDYTHTGRRVKLGDRWYQTHDIGVSNASRVYVTSVIISSETTGASVTFHRDHRYVKTSKIRNIQVGNYPKITRFASQDLRKQRYIDIEDLTDSIPYGYQDIVTERISSPAFQPKYTSAGSGSFTNGKYIYFYTLYDSESEFESAPGPLLVVEVTDGFSPVITYDNPATADVLETSSYQMRLYRSNLISATDTRPRTRLPMFLVQTRPPTASPFTDTSPSVIRGLPRYWDGPWSGVRLISKPSEVDIFHIEALNDYGARPMDEDQIRLGPVGEVTELLRLFMAGMSSLKSKDSAAHRQSIVDFRRQLEYLLNKDREPGQADESASNMTNYAPRGDADWVDSLRSPWED
jgi:hypothetical protein